LQNFTKLAAAIEDGLHAFMRFMNPALDVYLRLRQDAGATVTFDE
jgi:hypothetical protein